MRPRDVLAAWFGEPGGNLLVAERQAPLWWGRDAATDRALGQRFGPAVETALAGGLGEWARDARGRLALVLLLDQLPRNLFRGTPRAFAGDERARGLSREAVDQEQHLRLEPLERVFLYLPLEHAEDLALQERSVELFAALAQEVPPEQRELFTGFVDYAVAHRDIIARFGRFPHRNAILGRDTSPEEAEFLRLPGSSF